MLRRKYISQALVFCLVFGVFATLYPIRNATEQLNNKEASAYGSSHVKYVSLGDSHSCAVTSAGGVKCWGLNTSGQVGNSGAGSYPSTPVDVTGLTSGVSSVALGDTHSCVVTSGGGVKCWGSNSSGQLGDGTTTSRSTPVSVLASAGVELTGIVAVSAGSAHSCALTSTGGVKCWGGNTSGQLGNDSVTNSSTPVDVLTSSSPITPLSGVTAISVGGSYSCALMSNGTVKCWGDAAYGQLGNGNTNNQKTPVSVLASAGVDLSGVSAISTGTWHACALMSGTVKCWGDNDNYQLGNNSPDSNIPVTVPNLSGVSGIAAGRYTSCALKSGGVQCWGQGTYGELGNKTTTGRSEVPVTVHTSSSNSAALSGVSAIAMGSVHVCALMNEGGLKCWGSNGSSQLGRGSMTPTETTPANVSVSGFSFGEDTTAPAFSAAAVNSAGTQVIVGFSEALSATTASLSAFSISVNGESRTPTAMSIVGSTVVLTTSPAITAGQTVTFSYTDPTAGNDANAIQDSSGNDASSIVTASVSNHVVTSSLSLGSNHSCAVASTGGVKCWGYGTYGQLGNNASGAFSERTTPVDVHTSSSSSTALSGVSAIALGSQSSCALTTAGGVKCWGANNYGQLGDGTQSNRSTPLDVRTSSSSSTALSGVTAIDIGGFHSCAVTATGGVKCWGWSGDGQLGDGSSGDTTKSTSPVDVHTSSTSNTPLSGVKAIALGYEHSCALTTAGGVKCWGDNNSGQLGNGSSGSSADRTTPVDVTGLSSGVSAIALGANHSCALTTTGGVKCWGSNYSGQLGNGSSGSSADRNTPVDVTGLTSGVAAIALGDTHSCALMTTGGVKCWGRGELGQLGNGSTTDRSTPVDVSVSGFSFGVDTTAPIFSSAATNTSGTTITLTYSEALSAATAVGSDFTVLVGGVSRSVSGVAVSGSTVVLTLASAVGAGQTVSVAYTDPTNGNDTNAVQDAAGNDAATLAATSVTNSVPAPSSGGSPDPGTTTTTTTSTTVAPTATTTTTVAPTTATVRSGTTVPRRTTTTTAVNRTTTTTIRSTTTTAFRPLEPLAPIVSTTTSVLSPATSTAKASVTSVAISSIESLQQAEGRLKAVEAQTSTANNDLRIAQIKLGESIVAVLDPKSALAVAVNVAEEKVVSLSAASASAEQIAAAVAQLENLKIAISQNVSLSIERIAEAQSRLAAVLANPAATAEQVAVAKAELVSARVPDVGVVAEILTVANSDSHLQPVIIPGVVDNPGTGQFVLLDGATAKSIEITRINGTSLRMTSTDGFRLVISTRDKNGDPVQFNSRGGIVVKHGNLVSIAGEGFAPGTTAKTWLFSSPRELGNLNVSPDGSFAADFPITDDIRVGNHTAQVNGLSPDGEVRSLSLDVEILPNEGPAPYDPLANRLAVAALVAQAMALLALSRRKDNDEDDRDQADVSEVSVDHIVGSDGDRRDTYSPPVIRSLDQFLQRIPARLATTQQLLARIVHDAVYLRALTGVGGAMFALTGIVVGFFAAQSADFAGQSPTFVWLAALVVLGSLDALSGGLAALTIVITTGIAGGLNSTDSVRGLLGLAVMCFAIPLVASTTRPFRRAASDSVDRLWKRASDLALIAVFGAWAAGAMYDALPGLYGFTSSAAGRTTTIQLLVLGTLMLRFGLESLATRVTGQRLTHLVGATLPDSSEGRTVFSVLVRTIIMVFVAEAFIGNNIALWIGAGMYAIPKLIDIRAEHFPKSAVLKTWLPSGLLRTVVMLFVARWWASNISAFSEDPSTQLQAAFVLLGIPSLVLTSLGWFAGGGRKWRSTPVSKVLGIVVLAIGVLTVRGVLFA